VHEEYPSGGLYVFSVLEENIWIDEYHFAQFFTSIDDFKKLFSDQKIVKKSASAVLSGLSRRVD